MRSRSLVKVNLLFAALAVTTLLVFAGSRSNVAAGANAQATASVPTQAGRFPVCPPGARVTGTPTETPTVVPPDASKPVIFIGVVARSVAKCGARITAFRRGSPAVTAGARLGDVIVAVDGTPIDSSTAFFVAVAAKNPGDTVVLTVDRTVTRRATPSAGVRIAPTVEELDVAVTVGEVAPPTTAPGETPEATSES